jgi:hypothetical protein
MEMMVVGMVTVIVMVVVGMGMVHGDGGSGDDIWRC